MCSHIRKAIGLSTTTPTNAGHPYTAPVSKLPFVDLVVEIQ